MKLRKLIVFFIFLGALSQEKLFQASVLASVMHFWTLSLKKSVWNMFLTHRTLGFLLLANVVTNPLLKQNCLSNGCKVGNFLLAWNTSCLRWWNYIGKSLRLARTGTVDVKSINLESLQQWTLLKNVQESQMSLIQDDERYFWPCESSWFEENMVFTGLTGAVLFRKVEPLR